MQQIDTDITILKALQDLGALSDTFGLYEIKPFKDWPGSKWNDTIFKYRLLNTGEMLGVLRKIANETPDAKDGYKRLEILASAIWAINEHALAGEEDVIAYNKKNNTSLTLQEFLVNWMHNLEEIVVTRLEAVYAGLQVKQIRMLQGISACDSCGNIYKAIPPGSAILQYALAEIVCKDCMDKVDISLYDIKEIVGAIPVVDTPEAEKLKTKTNDNPYKCLCGEEFTDSDSYTTHIQTCEHYPA